MPSSPHLQRALLLQEQGRHELAEKELHQHLAAVPNDGFGRAALALSLLELKRRDAAEKTVREAIGHAPDLAFAHYALARVLADRNREAEAAAAMDEALRLDPADADYHAMKAAIAHDRRRWADALAAAEAGLEFDPEHVACNNLRAMALTQLGRRAEAGATMDATLSRAPENAFAHANKGWTLLHDGDRRQAMVHFREALRLEPTSDWARAGLVEALKAGNPVYAVMLKYFLWMARLPAGTQWAIILGGWFGNRLLGSVSRDNPALAPWLGPVRLVYLAFVVLTWLAVPLFNLLLRLHPEGRHALTDEQKTAANWIGGTMAVALAGFAGWLAAGRAPALLMLGIAAGLLSLPLAARFNCAAGWPRRVMTAACVVLGLLGLGTVLAEWRGMEVAGLLLGFFLLGALLATLGANFLMGSRPKR
ncbi:MAG: tetratricopeptide repeat protein [Limisphaerales bacterium]